MQRTGLKPLAAGAALGSAARGEQDEVGGRGDWQEGVGRIQGITVVGGPQAGGGALGPADR